MRRPHKAVWSQVGHNCVKDQRDTALRGVGLHPGVDVLVHVAGDRDRRVTNALRHAGTPARNNIVACECLTSWNFQRL
jgi:hypothetical protein